MFAGIDNFFVLKKMFGDGDFFSGAQLNFLNIEWTLKGCRLSLELASPCPMVYKVARWKKRGEDADKMSYIYFNFFAVESVNAVNLRSAWEVPRSIQTGEIKPTEQGNLVYLLFNEHEYFQCYYRYGRIENVSNISHALY